MNMEDSAVSSDGKGKMPEEKVHETILTARTRKTCVTNSNTDECSNGKPTSVNGNGIGQVKDQKNGHSARSNGHPTEQRNGRLARNGRIYCSGRRRVRKPRGWADWLLIACGACVGVFSGVAYACFLYYLHENRLWFTHIKVSSDFIPQFLCSEVWNIGQILNESDSQGRKLSRLQVYFSYKVLKVDGF